MREAAKMNDKRFMLLDEYNNMGYLYSYKCLEYKSGYSVIAGRHNLKTEDYCINLYTSDSLTVLPTLKTKLITSKQKMHVLAAKIFGNELNLIVLELIEKKGVYSLLKFNYPDGNITKIDLKNDKSQNRDELSVSYTSASFLIDGSITVVEPVDNDYRQLFWDSNYNPVGTTLFKNLGDKTTSLIPPLIYKQSIVFFNNSKSENSRIIKATYLDPKHPIVYEVQQSFKGKPKLNEGLVSIGCKSDTLYSIIDFNIETDELSFRPIPDLPPNSSITNIARYSQGKAVLYNTSDSNSGCGVLLYNENGLVRNEKFDESASDIGIDISLLGDDSIALYGLTFSFYYGSQAQSFFGLIKITE
jgi:hypothetical protein